MPVLYQESTLLISWYLQNKRPLPWRNTRDPYLIWISEVILQQTQVKTGLGYYQRMVERFPDVFSMANAKEDDLLKLWEGLGYYSRARNMHATSREIASRYQGVFPNRFEELIRLKGIGQYTAAAIASIAFDEPVPVLDGNVYRVVSRLWAIRTPVDTVQGKKEFYQAASSLLDPSHAGDHNQAMMELGALICRPLNPDCLHCPLRDLCLAFKNDLVGLLPFKARQLQVKERYLTYFYMTSSQGQVFIQRRNHNDIWKGLYQLPLQESEMSPDEVTIQKSIAKLINQDCATFSWTRLVEKKHLLSHRILHILFVGVTLNEPEVGLSPDIFTIALSEVHQYAFPKPVKDFLHQQIRGDLIAPI